MPVRPVYRSMVVFATVALIGAFAGREPSRAAEGGGDEPRRKSPAAEYNLGKDRVAIKGYDPVSYYRESGPVKGRKDLTHEHEGVIYRFASEENRKAFAENVGKFKPTYGGWCAKAVADGQKVDVDPKNYKITDGRLFLFYKSVLGDALKAWNKDEANLTRRADEHWKRIAGE